MKFPPNNERITCAKHRATILLYPSHVTLPLCPSLAIQTFSYFQIKRMQTLLNPSLQRGDQGNISNDSTPHYPSVLSETLQHDKTFGLEHTADAFSI